MATLREIRRRILGIKSTQKITKAMKMVAAAKLRRAQDSIISARPYAKKMNELLRNVVKKIDPNLHPLLSHREQKNVLLVIVSSDRGLCGSFNSNILKKSIEILNTKYSQLLQENRVQLICIGRKGYQFFSKRDFPIFKQWIGIFSSLKFARAQEIAQSIKEAYESEKFDRVEIIYNEFKSIIQQRVVVEQFLPIPPAELIAKEKFSKSQIDYIYEPDVHTIVDTLIPKNLTTQIWRILLESNAAELGAKMAAMDNANENAKELLETLNLQMNKARQTSITKEILEITSGANALKSA
jgi:F-type H+-transporting ATPase subunit gamma